MNWELLFSSLANIHHWTPEQIGDMTLYQIRVLTLPIEGLEGIEHMHDFLNIDMSTTRDKRVHDPKKKIYAELRAKAVKNILAGRRWDSSGGNK